MSGDEVTKDFTFTCEAIDPAGTFRKVHTGRGADLSPAFELSNLSHDAVTCAVILEDLSHPLFHNFTHWVLWNVPAVSRIPGALPTGRVCRDLGGAQQGAAYGWHRYAGPKPPRGRRHTYRFTLYVLDEALHVSWPGTKRQFLAAAEGHVLQKASVQGMFG